jgi:hypothetical protein
MLKANHEFRDPIHVFIRVESSERRVIDSAPFQRLRNIHQLALTYLVYPGATHKRFEHSLGVMELAARVYDTVTNPANLLDDRIRKLVPAANTFEHQYWRRVLRMAALCHDIGHLPFSHAAEHVLLPSGWTHERISKELIASPEMSEIWSDLKIDPKHVCKLALGPGKYKDGPFSDWEAILAEIIVGDSFGVDRIDYLLRDSHHTGVGYGKFDHYRLIDCLRVLPKEHEDSDEPTLGVEEGGLHSAEAMLLARYFMFSQVYLHPVRRIYDIHLIDFLAKILPNGQFPIQPQEFLGWTDNEVLSELRRSAMRAELPGHEHATRILSRDHFKLVYSRNPDDISMNPNPADAISRALIAEFGPENVRKDAYRPKSSSQNFPVLERDDRIVSSQQVSETLRNLPIVALDYVFVSPSLRDSAQKLLKEKRKEILSA